MIINHLNLYTYIIQIIETYLNLSGLHDVVNCTHTRNPNTLVAHTLITHTLGTSHTRYPTHLFAQTLVTSHTHYSTHSLPHTLVTTHTRYHTYLYNLWHRMATYQCKIQFSMFQHRLIKISSYS